jgi:hypothetical protein
VAVHRARSALADDEGPFEERATTLLVARVDASSVETAQVGDGAVVLRRDGLLEVLAPDAKGEYLNETTFLTSASWRDDLRLASVPAGGIDGVAVLTDGLQLIAFDLVTGAPHGPFFEPFFAFAADGGPEADLARFLGSERVGSRTDDDVTLAVAVRASAPSA